MQSPEALLSFCITLTLLSASMGHREGKGLTESLRIALDIYSWSSYSGNVILGIIFYLGSCQV